jgi:curved DNA-binding protein CbpA
MNYYDVLGVSPTASPEDINASHKALAKMYHPDINSGEKAHEQMAMLNRANEVLSDPSKREQYDDELRRGQNNRQQRQNKVIFTSQAATADRPHIMSDIGEQPGKAETLRRKAEERLRAEAAAQKRRLEQSQKKAEEAAEKNRRSRAEHDRQYVIDVLSALVMNDSAKRLKKMDVDDERFYATKVLLAMLRNDGGGMRRIAEDAERKQRIEEILSLVKEYNDNKEAD